MQNSERILIELIRNLESYKQCKDSRRVGFFVQHPECFNRSRQSDKEINLRYYKGFENLLELLGEHFINTALAQEYSLEILTEFTCAGGIAIQTEDSTIEVIVDLNTLAQGVCNYNIMVDGEYFNPAPLIAKRMISAFSDENNTIAESLYDCYILANRFSFSGKTLEKELGDSLRSAKLISGEKRLEEVYTKWKAMKVDVLLGNAWLFVQSFSQALSFFNTLLWYYKIGRSAYRWESRYGSFRDFSTKCCIKDTYSNEHGIYTVKEISVACGSYALAQNSLISFSTSILCVFTDSTILKNVTCTGFDYYYRNMEIDYEYEVEQSKENPLLLIPSKERAIVECIKWLEYVDEGELIEALKTYLDMYWDNKIYEVGEHFGISKETLDYWFEEARNDKEI